MWNLTIGTSRCLHVHQMCRWLQPVCNWLHNSTHTLVASHKTQDAIIETACETRNTPNPSSAAHNPEEKRIGVTMKDQKKLSMKRPTPVPNSRALKVALIGPPNAGKSTLANKLIGWKFAAVSQKVHTTRHRTIGVLTEDNKQVVFLDTPGIIVPGKLKRHNLERTLLADPHAALYDADLIAVVVDTSHVWHRTRLDPEILKVLTLHSNKQSVLVLNKVDLMRNKRELLHMVRTLTEGVVGGQRHWKTIRRRAPPSDLQAMFDRMQHGGNGNNVEPESTSPATTEMNCEDRVVEKLYAEDGSVIEIRESARRLGDEPDDSAEEPTETESQWQEGRLAATRDRDAAVDLHQPEAWSAYYRRLEAIGREIEDKRGWERFERVFMISALSGDGVFDLKHYLLDCAYPSPWVYDGSVVTDQNPVELARLCVWERLLDHLPDEIPYQVKIKLSLWEVGEDDMLRAVFDIVCSRKRHLHRVLGTKGETVKRIAAEAKQELMNAFRREMSLQLVVRGTGDFFKKPI